MNRLKRITYRIAGVLSLAILLTGVYSCTKGDSGSDDPKMTDVEFVVSFPDDGNSTKAKTDFVSGDNIYVTAEIKLDDNSTEYLSTILTYGSGKWNIKSGATRLRWPVNAVGGVFKAYYLPNGKTISDDSTPTVIDFADLTEAGDDPLMAQTQFTATNGVVYLQFTHTLTKLWVTGLTNGTDESFHNSAYAIVNQVSFEYNALTGYSFSYSAKDGDGVRMPVQNGRATFFLHVDKGDWELNKSAFVLTSYGVDNEETLVRDNIGLYTMLKGCAYYIGFSNGSENAALAEFEKWYAEKTEGPKVFDAESDIVAYFASHNKLTEDLDFNNIPLTTPLSALFVSSKSIPLTQSFDGNYHTIKNICATNGLFEIIPAGFTVQNLQLENVTINTGDVTDPDVDCAGMLAPINMGTIRNIRIKGNNTICTHNSVYTGGLVGINLGTITNVEIFGSLTMECYLDGANVADRAFCVGGMVGANGNASTASKSITGSSIIAASSLSVSGGSVTSDAYVGGFVGYNAITSGSTTSVNIRNCQTNINVDASLLIDTRNCYVGGFVGENLGAVISSSASGNIIGGVAQNIAATGGFIGHASSKDGVADDKLAVLNSCSAMGNVTETDASGDVYTGGVAGFIETDIKNSYSTGIIGVKSGNSDGKNGAFVGVISADKFIYNSFSVSRTSDNSSAFKFSGLDNSMTLNCHYKGFVLDNKGEPTARVATPGYLNIAVEGDNGYFSWSSAAAIYNGIPYLVKE